MERRILFGCGATKAGTSWLHRWLSRHPDCRFRTLKELHYFDAIHGGRVDRKIAALEEERSVLAAEGASAQRIGDIDAYIDALRRSDDRSAYIDYLNEGAGDATVVGDVTPAYGLLPVGRLREMVRLGDTRFLYILRDPVARLWSHVRMMAGRREPDGSVTAERANRILGRVIRGDEPDIAVRSDYRGAMERLGSAVPEARRLFIFFEELFSPETAERICAFLGIRTAPPLAEVVHAGHRMAMTAEQHSAARRWLDDQYAYVSDAMGRVPPAWTERM